VPTVFCQTATIYAVHGRGKAGIRLPVQFVTSGTCDSGLRDRRRSTISEPSRAAKFGSAGAEIGPALDR
jgi:hypothetical protein